MLAVFPGLILLVIGCVVVDQPVHKILHIEEYEPAVMTVDSLETYSTDPQGIILVGKIGEKNVKVDIGSEGNDYTAKLWSLMRDHKKGSFRVYHNAGANKTIPDFGETSSQIKKRSIRNLVLILLFFFAPFTVTTLLGICYHLKIRKISRA